MCYHVASAWYVRWAFPGSWSVTDQPSAGGGVSLAGPGLEQRVRGGGGVASSVCVLAGGPAAEADAWKVLAARRKRVAGTPWVSGNVVVALPLYPAPGRHRHAAPPLTGQCTAAAHVDGCTSDLYASQPDDCPSQASLVQ